MASDLKGPRRRQNLRVVGRRRRMLEQRTQGAVSDDSHAAITEPEANVAEPIDISAERPQPKPKTIDGTYRKAELHVPSEINEAPGIIVNGRAIKSLVFSTDLAIVTNCDADAVFAVYPFTCQPSITQALLGAAHRPVFTGVAGRLTGGARSIELAVFSEMQGAAGVVLNAPAAIPTIQAVCKHVDIPVVMTVTKLTDYAIEQIGAGPRIVNVTAGKDTAEVVAQVRAAFPDIAIMATGGNKPEAIRATIAAGADAISWTPPSLAELQRQLMNEIREDADNDDDTSESNTA